jgi:hypothetical protein
MIYTPKTKSATCEAPNVHHAHHTNCGEKPPRSDKPEERSLCQVYSEKLKSSSDVTDLWYGIEASDPDAVRHDLTAYPKPNFTSCETLAVLATLCTFSLPITASIY